MLLAALLVLLFGPHHDQGPALIVLAITAAVAVSSWLGGFNTRIGGKSLAERRAEFHSDRPRLGEPAELEADEAAWQRERERRDAIRAQPPSGTDRGSESGD